MLLSMEGHDVRVAFDGDEAINVAHEFEPELLLLDVGRPKRNGYEVAQLLRERYPQRCTRLVALSGWGQAGDKLRAHVRLRPASNQTDRSGCHPGYLERPASRGLRAFRRRATLF